MASARYRYYQSVFFDEVSMSTTFAGEEVEKQVLYIMQNELSLYKIGISNDVERRRRELKNTSGLDVKIIDIPRIFELDAYEVEQTIHKILSRVRRQGEWFSCNLDEIYQAYEQIISAHQQKILSNLKSREDKFLSRERELVLRQQELERENQRKIVELVAEREYNFELREQALNEREQEVDSKEAEYLNKQRELSALNIDIAEKQRQQKQLMASIGDFDLNKALKTKAQLKPLIEDHRKAKQKADKARKQATRAQQLLKGIPKDNLADCEAWVAMTDRRLSEQKGRYEGQLKSLGSEVSQLNAKITSLKLGHQQDFIELETKYNALKHHCSQLEFQNQTLTKQTERLIKLNDEINQNSTKKKRWLFF